MALLTKLKVNSIMTIPKTLPRILGGGDFVTPRQTSFCCKKNPLEDQVALVTGAAQGIGLASCLKLCCKGLKGVCVVDINPCKGTEAATKINERFGCKKAIFCEADVCQPEKLNVAFETVLKEFGRLDIVVSNAGTMNDKEWDKAITTNCNGTMHTNLLGLKHLGKHGGKSGGTIINISSLWGVEPFCAAPAYAATSGFVLGLTRSFGKKFHYNYSNVKFIAVLPGVTESELMEKGMKLPLPNIPDLQKHLEEELKKCPPQLPDNVAEAVFKALIEGDNGSIWVSEGCRPVYEVEIPNKDCLRTCAEEEEDC